MWLSQSNTQVSGNCLTFTVTLNASQHASTCMGHRAHMEINFQPQRSTDHIRETVPSHTLMGERTRGGGGGGGGMGRRRGRDEATFFPEEGGFRGAWVKSLECDCVAVHEKSAPHMPLPPHSLCPHWLAIPTFWQSSLVDWYSMRGRA